MNNSYDGVIVSNNYDDFFVKELKIDMLDCRKSLVKCEEFVNDLLND